jgi:hypothetical protein
MLRQILAIIFLATLGGCSSNPVSTERLSDFDIQKYNTFQVSAFAQSNDVRVSPFTSELLEAELSDELQVLGLSLSKEAEIAFKISLSIDEETFRRSGLYVRRGAYYPYYDPFYNDFSNDLDRSFLRVTAYSTESGKTLWTGIRPIKSVRNELRLSEEEVSKYIDSFILELLNS